MKFITKALFSILFLFISLQAFAQAPQSFSYQAIARNGNSILANANIGVQFLIRDVSPTGTIVYSESNNLVTNQYGLFTAMIGLGNQQTGTFSAIDWANGGKFLQVKIDVTGGTNYVDLGTTQLISVPYALHANKADTAAYAMATVTPPVAQYAVFEERYPNATNPPQSTSYVWNPVTLNTTQVASGTDISRTGNVITLQPGTYHINGFCTTQLRGSATGFCSYNIRLRNTINSTVALTGYTNEQKAFINYSGHFYSSMEGYITVTSSQTFVVENWIWTEYTPPTTGHSSSDGSDEVFCRISIKKM